MSTDLSPLFEPLTLRGVTLPNRFVMPPMQRLWSIEGRPPQFMADYYGERSKGGVGLLASESTAIDHISAATQQGAARINPSTKDGWAACFDAVHQHGGKMLLQLWHEGGNRDPSDGHTLTPSGLLHPDKPAGRQPTSAELDQLREAYARSARLAIDAGADGIELHCCHGYFLDLWLWHETNLRTDGYGGARMADRVRFPAEVASAIRAEIGPDRILSVRFSQWKNADYLAQVAATPDELAEMLEAFAGAGVDLFSASSRWFDRPLWPELDSDLSLSGWVKRVTDVPVITVGSFGLNLDVMNSLTTQGQVSADWEAAIRELMRRYHGGEFDLLAVGRSLIADPEFVAKLRDGRYDEIRVFKKEDVDDLSEHHRGRHRVRHQVGTE